MKKFTMIDESFKCLVCQQDVKPLGYTARDHCPHCLYSLHVDINPGDRKEKCHGLLEPINIEKFKKTYKIVYRCQKCHQIKKNVMAEDDDFETILKIIKKSIDKL